MHTGEYLAELERTVPGARGWLDSDTYYSPDTWEAALAAAGAAIDLTSAVLDGSVRRGLSISRPPGHHAEADRAMGFCLFNNVAAAAAAARAGGIERVTVLDWDVHHGNGTQHIFEEDSAVQFLSMHQFPFYPGTGAPTEVGRGEGRGATMNVGLPSGAGDNEFIAAWREVFAPAIRRHGPQLVLVSGGFDAFAADPLAELQVTASAYRTIAGELCGLADELCDGRVVCALEGGYDLAGLGQCVTAVFEAFAADAPGAPEEPARANHLSVEGRAAIDATLAAHAALGASGPGKEGAS